MELDDIEVDESTNLKELDQYDSLTILGIIAFIDEKFNKRLTADNFKSVNTIESLIRMIGEEYIE